jgi:ERCC4-type nuclease
VCADYRNLELGDYQWVALEGDGADLDEETWARASVLNVVIERKVHEAQ